MSLVLFTCMVGLLIAPNNVDLNSSLISLLAVAIGSGAAGALNMWYESDLDALMSRTCLRPIPAGKVKKNQALYFGIILSALSISMLYLAANLISAILLASTIGFYFFIYTIWLKRKTPQNIVIGGAAGAIPPIIGWVTVVPEINFLPIMMFMIIFFWTPPHFWALSVYRFNDYEKVKVPMLPNVKSIADTKNQIIYYTIILILLSYTPLYSNLIGYLYFMIVTVLNFVLIRSAFKLKNSEEVKGVPNKEGLRFFALTIFYLFSLFSALLIDNLILL